MLNTEFSPPWRSTCSLVLAIVLVACGPSEEPAAPGDEQAAAPPEPAEACVLTLGWDPWAPYQYLGEDGEMRGLDVELTRAITDRMGCELEFKQGEWVSLLGELRAGGIDMLAGASLDAERTRFAHFSDPYRNESFTLYVRAGEAGNHPAASIEELLTGDFRLGVVFHYIYGNEVGALEGDERYAKKFYHVSTSELNFTRLLDNDIDGFLEDPVVAASTLRRKGLGDQIEPHPLEIHSGEVHFMLSRESVDDGQLAAFNEALAGLRGDGGYDEIMGKYLR